MNYLKFYEDCMETGELPENGLCRCIGERDLFKLFIPNEADFLTLSQEGKSSYFWADNVKYEESTFSERATGFNPLRQNIVLFCAAINDEL